ncbi:MAG: bifunctional (p)ppGpp synthetase/guanosine-3',5'-bis(diphosphate) 3'-pyrophosphohydrolase [Bacteroidales bacterium]|nr:bifunctional (p)ppGpp synthetase/guanosine-3',5'-bis(diphosphate) 3'-pyrophosphohydrolase [Bacteroidales bacterium]
MDKIQLAWNIASKIHDGQKYGGIEKEEHIEYLSHIGAVVFEIYNATSCIDYIDTDFAVKCAILHDSLEDTSLEYSFIKQTFGEKVAQGVLALTKDPKIPDKIIRMIDCLQRIKLQPPEIAMVKLADRICNLKAPPYFWSQEKIITYKAEAEIIYNELKNASALLAQRLLQKISEYQQFIDN